MKRDDPDLVQERHGTTLLVRFTRSQHGNSVQGRLFRDLIDAAEAADRSGDVRAVVTIGSGSTYCVGADRRAFAELIEEGPINLTELGYQGAIGGDWGPPYLTPDQTRTDVVGPARWVSRFLALGIPTIAALNAGVAGGGFALALMHDVRIAARDAKIAPNVLRLGASPELGMSWLLPRIVGHARAFDVLTRTAPIAAEEALELGLVEAVVEPDELLDAALARAADFAELSAPAVRMSKALLNRSWESSQADQMEREWHHQVRLFGLPETGARIKGFFEQVVRGR